MTNAESNLFLCVPVCHYFSPLISNFYSCTALIIIFTSSLKFNYRGGCIILQIEFTTLKISLCKSRGLFGKYWNPENWDGGYIDGF